MEVSKPLCDTEQKTPPVRSGAVAPKTSRELDIWIIATMHTLHGVSCGEIAKALEYTPTLRSAVEYTITFRECMPREIQENEVRAVYEKLESGVYAPESRRLIQYLKDLKAMDPAMETPEYAEWANSVHWAHFWFDVAKLRRKWPDTPPRRVFTAVPRAWPEEASKASCVQD
ncbi:MAG: hypothetical protein Q9170_002022 [Blastenia crenularia]